MWASSTNSAISGFGKPFKKIGQKCVCKKVFEEKFFGSGAAKLNLSIAVN